MKPTNLFAHLEYLPASYEQFEKLIFEAKTWEKISPVEKVFAKFSAPNVLYSEMQDTLQLDLAGLLKLNINVVGNLVLDYKGVDGDKGHLYEVYVRNNNYVNKLDARLRVKEEGQKLKVGVFLQAIEFNSGLLDRGIGKDALIVALKLKVKKLLENLLSGIKEGTL